EAERVCEKIAIIYKGKLRAMGTISELKDSIPRGDVIEIQYEGSRIPEKLFASLEEYGRIETQSSTLRIYVEKGEEKVLDIIDLFRKNNVKILRIMVKEPTLDDVFTYITGAKLREES
ncbi:MAG: DUF4162 domain-containing protein, partial [Desulfurococcaceae archaeon]